VRSKSGVFFRLEGEAVAGFRAEVGFRADFGFRAEVVAGFL
jgi:hypothetical protein